jgi:DNA-binding HxlR family transcriptional regulator
VTDLAAALDVVGPRWALLIVERLLDGPQRYGDLQRDLGVPTNILATRLCGLEAAGELTDRRTHPSAEDESSRQSPRRRGAALLAAG